MVGLFPDAVDALSVGRVVPLGRADLVGDVCRRPLESFRRRQGATLHGILLLLDPPLLLGLVFLIEFHRLPAEESLERLPTFGLAYEPRDRRSFASTLDCRGSHNVPIVIDGLAMNPAPVVVDPAIFKPRLLQLLRDLELEASQCARVLPATP